MITDEEFEIAHTMGGTHVIIRGLCTMVNWDENKAGIIMTKDTSRILAQRILEEVK